MNNTAFNSPGFEGIRTEAGLNRFTPVKTFPAWDDDGLPLDLRAAAEDADAWLSLIQRLHNAGNWPFSQSDSAEKLAGCRAALRKHLEAQL